MGTKVLQLDQEKRRSKIGNPPERILAPVDVAAVISINELSSKVQKARIIREGARETERFKMNLGDADAVNDSFPASEGDEPIPMDAKEWEREVLSRTGGSRWGHPSQDWLAAYHRGETDD